MAMAIRTDVLRELMKDKEFIEKLKKARGWSEILDVLREFVRKKGYKSAEVYMEAKEQCKIS